MSLQTLCIILFGLILTALAIIGIVLWMSGKESDKAKKDITQLYDKYKAMREKFDQVSNQLMEIKKSYEEEKQSEETRC